MKISTIIQKFRDLIVNGFFNFFPRKGANENVVQYILRQFYLTDSKGTPSLTVTILFFVMVLVVIVTFVECQVALSWVYVYSAGVLIGKHLAGFSVTFLSLIISLSVVITTFYRQRQNKVGSDEKGEVLSKGMVDQTKSYIDSVLGSGKPGPPTPPAGTPPAGK